MEDLDRVLDREDVLPARAVDVVDHRRKGGRLARSGRTGDENEASVIAGEATDPRRKLELLEGRNLARDDAEGERNCATLAEAVDAEARQARMGEGHVELAGLAEFLQLAG